MDLSVKLLEPAAWLQKILDQEGVPCELIKVKKNTELDLSIVAIFSRNIGRIPSKLIVTNHKALARVLGKKVKSSAASAFIYNGKQGQSYLEVFSVDLRELNSFQELGHHLDRFGRKIPFSGVILGETAGKQYVSLPWNMSAFPSQWLRWSLYLTTMRINERLFCETAPRVDDRLVREVVFEALALGYQRINAPIVRVSPRITGPGYVAIRIDADGHSPLSTDRVAAVSRSTGVQFSWFIDTWSWKKESATIRELSRFNEIALHSYFHLTSIWRKSNLRNIRKGLQFLRKQGVAKGGFVSPFGHWNPGLRDALSIEQFSYSSEFALSRDVFPSKTIFRGRSSPLQIPSIPISLGVWTGSKNYWSVLHEEIQLRLDEAGFAVFYDHPLGRLEHQVEKLHSLIETISDSGHEFVTLEQLRKIIDTRPKIVSVEFVDEEVKYEIEGQESPHFSVEKIWGKNLQAIPKLDSLGLGIGRQNSFSIAWRKTLFFGLVSTIPIGLHISWAQIRRLALMFLKDSR